MYILNTMKKNYLWVFLIASPLLSASAQDTCIGRLPNQQYLNEIKLFFQQLGPQEFRTDSIDLKEQVDMRSFLMMEEEGDMKFDMLTPAEVEQIKEQMRTPPLQCWNKSLVTRASLLLTNAQTDGSATIRPRYGFYSLSVPLFFRDFTLCVFANGYYCGSLCGRGHMSVYKKVNGQWEKLKVINEWVS